MKRTITLPTPHGALHGQFESPALPSGLILQPCVHAATLETALARQGLATGSAVLSVELLTEWELHYADATQNVARLTERLIAILGLIQRDGDMLDLPLGIAASGDLTPAAIRAAARRDRQIGALACHGGLIDRAGVEALELLTAPLRVLFDADDEAGRIAFRRAATHLACRHETINLSPGEDGSSAMIAWLKRSGVSPARDQ